MPKSVDEIQRPNFVDLLKIRCICCMMMIKRGWGKERCMDWLEKIDMNTLIVYRSPLSGQYPRSNTVVDETILLFLFQVHYFACNIPQDPMENVCFCSYYILIANEIVALRSDSISWVRRYIRHTYAERGGSKYHSCSRMHFFPIILVQKNSLSLLLCSLSNFPSLGPGWEGTQSRRNFHRNQTKLSLSLSRTLAPFNSILRFWPRAS